MGGLFSTSIRYAILSAIRGCAIVDEPILPEIREEEGAFELSWELFGELCRALALRVARDYDPEAVVGIAAAGVIPGAVIAAMLGKEFYAIKITRREEGAGRRSRPEILSAAPPQLAGRRVLLVDEICETGDTLRLALAAVRDVDPAEVRTATSLVHVGGYEPDYYALAAEGTVVFPWDREVVDEESGRLVVNPEYEGLDDQC
ncbi:MAG: phosphoribosyl transferase [Gemmatimonadota bacterium]|nr:MAG: phosphoribosyl transferase [Gemmatimonadota bacterium]